MSESKIEWTELTWNPTTGCDKISAGCKNCYAEKMSLRLQKMGLAKYAAGFALREHPEALAIPTTWKKPAMVFVNSMSDLFHDEVSVDFLERVFAVMNAHPHLTFQVLTKRARNAAELADRFTWTPNIWMGVSVENQAAADERIPHLLAIPAKVRFLSCEPLLGAVKLDHIRIGDNQWFPLQYLHWVIAGGESGPGARPMHPDWPRGLRDQCASAGVPFFFKQWGDWVSTDSRNFPAALVENGKQFKTHIWEKGASEHFELASVHVGKSKAGRLLDGVEHSAFPAAAS